MSPAQIILLVLFAVAMTVVGFAVARLTATTPKPEPKRFGLKQARAVVRIANEAARELGGEFTTSAMQAVAKTTAKALRRHTVKVLGYEDTVGPELEAFAVETTAKNETFRERASDVDVEIADLEAKIRFLEGENEQLTLDAQANSQRLVEANDIASLFTENVSQAGPFVY